MSAMYRFLSVLFLSLLFACSSEKPSAQDKQASRETPTGIVSETSQSEVSPAGSYSVSITPIPSESTRKSTLYLNAQGFAVAEAVIEWQVNGETIAGQTRQFKMSELRKGDKVQVKATIKGREVLSNEVLIKNAPPVLSKVRFVLDNLKPGETMGVEASADDIDGDEVSYTYEWTKNGEPAGNEKTFKLPVKRGDKLAVRITPFDGEAYGRSVVLEREITNSPPTIIGHRKSDFDGKAYTYQVKASDPDGDPLTYSLQSGPPGMTIDPSTGLVKWDVPEDFKGKASFTVSVSDGHGGEASQKMSVDIKRVQQ